MAISWVAGAGAWPCDLGLSPSHYSEVLVRQPSPFIPFSNPSISNSVSSSGPQGLPG